ncbi:MAG: DUF2059 domain-containing protein, partial [Alphaproteobacteria bacterium]|nr:DUF2059 domain-containing protein [Alphaproteobacteria bacterium]
SFLFILTFAPIIAQAEPISDETLESLILLSRVEDQLELYPEITKQGFKDSAIGQAKNAQIILGAFDDAVDREIKPSDLIEVLKKNLKSDLSEEQAQEFMDWVSSDLGQEILEAEIKASQVTSAQEIQNAAQDLLRDQKGLEIAAEINKAVNGTYLMMSLQEKSMKSSMKALEALRPENERLSDAEIDKIVAAQLSQSLDQIDQTMALTFSYTYRNIRNEDKQLYLEFLHSPTGQKFSEITNKSLLEGLSIAYDKLAMTFIENLQAGAAAE